MSEHYNKLMEKHSKDYSIWVKEGDKVEKHTDCRIIHLDETGITFMDNKKLGKSKITFVPMFSLIRVQQEFV
ncbi:MAG: hypothetical protein INQ03_21735 [Candidatus Heimdallarchaeota archaeon]|nr:hypothetical protein [Candidatus Heimdallarchaeota archaeon]